MMAISCLFCWLLLYDINVMSSCYNDRYTYIYILEIYINSILYIMYLYSLTDDVVLECNKDFKVFRSNGYNNSLSSSNCVTSKSQNELNSGRVFWHTFVIKPFGSDIKSIGISFCDSNRKILIDGFLSVLIDGTWSVFVDGKWYDTGRDKINPNLEREQCDVRSPNFIFVITGNSSTFESDILVNFYPGTKDTIKLYCSNTTNISDALNYDTCGSGLFKRNVNDILSVIKRISPLDLDNIGILIILVGIQVIISIFIIYYLLIYYRNMIWNNNNNSGNDGSIEMKTLNNIQTTSNIQTTKDAQMEIELQVRNRKTTEPECCVCLCCNKCECCCKHMVSESNEDNYNCCDYCECCNNCICCRCCLGCDSNMTLSDALLLIWVPILIAEIDPFVYGYFNYYRWDERWEEVTEIMGYYYNDTIYDYEENPFSIVKIVVFCGLLLFSILNNIVCCCLKCERCKNITKKQRIIPILGYIILIIIFIILRSIFTYYNGYNGYFQSIGNAYMLMFLVYLVTSVDMFYRNILCKNNEYYLIFMNTVIIAVSWMLFFMNIYAKNVDIYSVDIIQALLPYVIISMIAKSMIYIILYIVYILIKHIPSKKDILSILAVILLSVALFISLVFQFYMDKNDKHNYGPVFYNIIFNYIEYGFIINSIFIVLRGIQFTFDAVKILNYIMYIFALLLIMIIAFILGTASNGKDSCIKFYPINYFYYYTLIGSIIFLLITIAYLHINETTKNCCWGCNNRDGERKCCYENCCKNNCECCCCNCCYECQCCKYYCFSCVSTYNVKQYITLFIAFIGLMFGNIYSLNQQIPVSLFLSISLAIAYLVTSKFGFFQSIMLFPVARYVISLQGSTSLSTKVPPGLILLSIPLFFVMSLIQVKILNDNKLQIIGVYLSLFDLYTDILVAIFYLNIDWRWFAIQITLCVFTQIIGAYKIRKDGIFAIILGLLGL